MRHLVIASVLTISVTAIPLVLADEAATDYDGSHHFVKDSVITTRVKAQLAAKHLTTLTSIKVDTDENGVVWLSGRAPTQDAVELASLIAINTDGVTVVHNYVAIQP
jgi:hyperosmotically inducible periplasmic protein